MGLIERRLRGHAHDVRVALPLVRHVAEHFPDDQRGRFGSIDAAFASEVAQEGETLAAILEGGRSMMLPSPGELHPWQARARVCIKAAKELWPEVVVEYAQGLESKKDRRLIRSM